METLNLKLITTQIYPDHENSEEAAIEAVVAERNGSAYITFKQPIPDYNVMINTMVKIKNGTVSVRRTGGVNMTLEFNLDKEYTTDYETPYGAMDIRIITTSIESEILQGHVNLKICYEMIMQGKKISDNIYLITN